MAHSAQDATGGQLITLTSRCLCNSHVFTAAVPRSQLPLAATCCHCTSCRHLTGALCSSGAGWPGPADAMVGSDLARFVYGEGGAVTIRFCGTCGTPMFYEARYAGRPPVVGVVTGTLDNVAAPCEVVRITDHIFLGDTGDGGASVWLMGPASGEGAAARRWMGAKGKSEELLHGDDWPGQKNLEPSVGGTAGKTDVGVWCKCRGVDLVLRPDFTGWKEEELPFFVDPDSRKSVAGFDVCDSCRLASGSDVVNWTFALLRHIRFAGSAGGGEEEEEKRKGFPETTDELKRAVSAPAETRDRRLGTLALYESSQGVQRYFCSRCSATVFYACDERPEMVDVPVGLLEGPGGGARVEEVLTWSLGGKASWKSDVVGGWREALVEAVQRESEEFRVRMGLPISYRRRQREEAEKNG